MLTDLRDLAGGESFEADVCVVGAGAAGISLARELDRAGRSVVLLESGGEAYEQATQALYDGPESGTAIPSGSGYLVSTRLRYFGGTTNHWNGYCRPLDPEVFSVRDWVSDVGWPFGRETLDPYYQRAAPLVEISPFDYDEAAAGADVKLLAEDPDVETAFYHVSPPTRFAQRYRPELEASPRIQLLLHANLLELVTDEAGGTVREARVARLDGTEWRVTARHFVLAAGGIENARLLLASDRVHRAGLGNEHDLVGRYFMEHPHVTVGYVTIPYWRKLIPRTYEESYVRERGNTIRGTLRLSAAAQREHRLMNAVAVLAHLTRAQERPLAAEVARLATDSIELGGHPPPEHGTTYYGWLEVHSEQRPNRESRVRLADERDALGVRRARLDWRLQPEDARNLLQTAERLALAMGAGERGRLRFLANEHDLWERTQWSYHHMGTTRMHDDPRHGVVDADARVHGVANLYVAGSSLFPTVGSSNPTLTIVALALRLADHLTAGDR